MQNVTEQKRVIGNNRCNQKHTINKSFFKEWQNEQMQPIAGNNEQVYERKTTLKWQKT